MEEKRIINETEDFMRNNVPQSRLRDGSDKSYLDHVLNGRKHALYLSKIYGADQFIVEIAILLHDVGADVGESHAAKSAKVAQEFLSRFKLLESIEDRILKCIRNHSIGTEVESLEEQIIQDADGLSFLEDTYLFYYEKIKRKHDIEKAKELTIKKINFMTEKIKTEKGKRLAKEMIVKSVNFVKNN